MPSWWWWRHHHYYYDYDNGYYRNQREREQNSHNQVMKEKENKQKQRMAELDMQRDKQRETDNRARKKQEAEHQQKMKELQMSQEKQTKELAEKQRKEAVRSVTSEINKLTNKLDKDRKLKTKQSKELEIITKTLKKDNDEIENWVDYQTTELEKYDEKIGLSRANKKYKRDNDEVEAAINKTGQHEDNVGKFLRLTHGLIGATMSTQSGANKLEIQLSTFGEIMGRECQSDVTVDFWFNQKGLETFIPICHQEGYKLLSDLECSNEKEFEEDILAVIKNAMKKEKEKENNDDDDDKKENENKKEDALSGEELAKQLLKQWGLHKFTAKMIDEGWDDPECWNELEDEDLTEMGFKKGNIKKFKNKLKQWASNSSNDDDDFILGRDKRILKEICLKPENWKKIQAEKQNITKNELLSVTPLLGSFFGKMRVTMNQTQQLLSYNQNLNDSQLKAIKMIDNKEENDQKDDDDKKKPNLIDMDDRNKFMLGSKCEIFSSSSNKWCVGTIANIKQDDKGEWIQVLYKTNDEERQTEVQRYSDHIRPQSAGDELTVQCRSLTKASIVGIDVVKSMISLFENNEITKKALPIAEGVEDCCMQIVRSQGDMRQSVLLAQNILKYKPSNFTTDETKKLWKAVDNGIIHIFKNALEMVKVTAQYFAFFLKFKQSFQHFVSCYNINENTSLSLAMEHIQKDVRDFSKFQSNFIKTIEALRLEASKCISDCVTQQSGAENFEKSRQSREETLKKYLVLKKDYDQFGTKLQLKFGQLIDKTITNSGTQKELEYSIKVLTESNQQNEKYLKLYRDTLNKLNTIKK